MVKQANTSSLIPRTNTKYDEAIVDTGVTSHYLTKDAPVIESAQENKIQITLPDGNKLFSTHTIVSVTYGGFTNKCKKCSHS